MNTKTQISKVRSVVFDLLSRDKATRSDDIYLYKLVIKEMTPGLLNKSFDQVLSEHFDNGLVHFETVRRTRAQIQSCHPELVDKVTYGKRKKKAETYIKDLMLA